MPGAHDLACDHLPQPRRRRSTSGVAALLLALLAAASSACRPPAPPFDPTLTARDTYTCCNLRFNRDHDATDANYGNLPLLVPAGTRVRVTEVGPYWVRFRTSDDIDSYYLELRFGLDRITPAQYFGPIFLDAPPTDRFESWPEAIRDAIRYGHVLVGMTREQVLAARGYPPLHRTGGLASDTWIFYESRGTITQVTFENDRVASMTSLPAP